jgi:hypothetical protein
MISRTALKSQVAWSFQKLSSPGFAGTMMRLSVTYIYPVFRSVADMGTPVYMENLETKFSTQQMVHSGLDAGRTVYSNM